MGGLILVKEEKVNTCTMFNDNEIEIASFIYRELIAAEILNPNISYTRQELCILLQKIFKGCSITSNIF